MSKEEPGDYDISALDSSPQIIVLGDDEIAGKQATWLQGVWETPATEKPEYAYVWVRAANETSRNALMERVHAAQTHRAASKFWYKDKWGLPVSTQILAIRPMDYPGEPKTTILLFLAAKK